MRTQVAWRWAAAVVAAAVLAAGARADEEKVPLDKLPGAVTDAVKAKFPGAKLVGASKEKEKGETIYEVSLKHKGHNIDVSFKADGTLVAVEKEIARKDLPEAVVKAVEDKYPKADFKKVEEITKDGKVTYEVLLVTAEKKKLEVVLDPKGKILEEEKKDKEKD